MTRRNVRTGTFPLILSAQHVTSEMVIKRFSLTEFAQNPEKSQECIQVLLGERWKVD